MSDESTVKTRANINEVRNFVAKNLGQSLTSISPLSGGEVALAFEITIDDVKTVFRLSPRLDLLEKDREAAKRFSSDLIPIPKVIDIGRYDDSLFYAQSEKANGKIVSSLSPDNVKTLLPVMMKTLGNIHSYPLKKNVGFGNWFPNEPSYESFDRYMLHLLDSEMPISRSIEEGNLFEKYLSKFKKGFQFMTTSPHLLHGDFGGGNLFVSTNKVTAVIDWGGSIYGDPLFDLAWLQFWWQDLDFLSTYIEQNQKNILFGENVKERLTSYQCYMGLRSIWFFSKSGQEDARNWTIERLSQIE